jgi:hypothetical protein
MKKLSLLMKCLLPIFIIFIHTVSVFAEESEIRVSIRGMLSNIADVGEFISSQTRLKLYPCETTGKKDVQMGKNGVLAPVPGQPEQTFYLDGLNRLVPVSTLSGTGLPDFGRFSFFKTRGLEPGKCYKICVMMLDKPYPGMVPLVKSDGTPLEIIIPEANAGENSHNIVVDLTKEPLIIPKPTVSKKIEQSQIPGLFME